MITGSDLDDLKQKFKDGIYGYENDEKWWELLVNGKNQKSKITGGSIEDGTGGNPFIEDDTTAESTPEILESIDETKDDKAESSKIEDIKPEPDNNLSRTYTLDLFENVSVKVIAERMSSANHERGYSVAARGSELFFKYWPGHDVFKRQLFKPADFLVNELAYQLHAITHNQLSLVPLTQVELSLREKYFPELHPSIDEIDRQVTAFMDDATEHLKNTIHILGSFDDSMLTDDDRKKISKALAEKPAVERKRNRRSF